MKLRINLIILASLFLISSGITFSQEAEKFKVGEIVEVHSYFFNPPWHKARVLNINTDCPYATTPYRVEFIGEDAGDHGKPCVGGNDIRPFASAQPIAGNNQAVNQNQNQRAVAVTTFQVGDRVDVIYDYARDKGTRGTIIEVGDGGYKIHFDGCGKYRDAFVDRMSLYPAATISADNAEIKFLTGKWSMTTIGISSVAIAWGKSPGIEIKPDGNYIWYQDGGKPPVKGKWATHAKIEGTKYGTEVENGIIIKDAKGGEWKVYRWKSPRDNVDHITVQTMCSGQTITGKRIR